MEHALQNGGAPVRAAFGILNPVMVGLVAALFLLMGCELPDDTDDMAANDHVRTSLLHPAAQPMSFGGGLEWNFWPEDDCRIYVREYGDSAADTWVVLHGGWGIEHSYLRDALAGLEQDFHLVFYDQRGSLRSQCPSEHVSVQAHLDDLDYLRQALDLERVNLIGHSMGGHLAARYLSWNPERSGRIVLVSPGMLKAPLDHDDSTSSVSALGRLARRLLDEVEG
jgi:predicted esterase